MKRLRGITKLWAIALAVLLTAQMAVPNVEAAEQTAAKIPEKTIDTDSKAGKSGAAVKVGDEIIYRITYKNDTEVKQDIVITDTLSAGLEFVKASESGNSDKGTVTWKLKDVEAGKTGAVTLTVKVTSGETVGNKATVKVGDKDPVSTSAVTNKVEKAAEPVPQTEPVVETPQADVQEPVQVENQEEEKQEVTPEVKAQAAETKVEPPVATTLGAGVTSDEGGGQKTCEQHDWKVINDTTECEKDGIITSGCTNCEEEKEEEQEAYGHKFTTWKTDIEATCGEPGIEKSVCDVEGCSKESTREIKATGKHKWKEKEVKEATCKDLKEVTSECEVCKTTKTETVGELSTKHTYSDNRWTTEEAPTCAKEGTKTRVCDECGKGLQRASIEKIAHDWETTYTVDKARAKPQKDPNPSTVKNCNATKDAKEIPATGDHSVSGLKSGTTYARNSKITFTVKGIGMDNASPIKGDVRYVPVKWSVNPEGTWEKAPYTASFTLSKNGDYTLKVTYDKEEFNGEKWVKTGDTDTTSVSFKIGDVKTTSKTAAKNTTKKGVPKTADTAPYASLIGLLLISGFISIYVIKKQTKNK